MLARSFPIGQISPYFENSDWLKNWGRNLTVLFFLLAEMNGIFFLERKVQYAPRAGPPFHDTLCRSSSSCSPSSWASASALLGLFCSLTLWHAFLVHWQLNQELTLTLLSAGQRIYPKSCLSRNILPPLAMGHIADKRLGLTRQEDNEVGS